MAKHDLCPVKCLMSLKGHLLRSRGTSPPCFSFTRFIEEPCFILQEDLTSLGQWEADWQMKLNMAKCHSMRVTWHQHHKQILFDYSLHNQTLENIQSAKYLGITISDIMDWDQHISEISSKAPARLSVSFAGIWLLHLGVLRKLHTKIWFGLN